MGQALTGLATDLVNLKRFDEAQRLLDRAQAILEKLGKDYPDLIYVLLIQGTLMLERGRPAEAIPPLDRALKLSPKRGALAEIQFTLARALWEARPSERSRAVRLATEARDVLQRIGHSPTATEASKWLAEHAAP